MSKTIEIGSAIAEPGRIAEGNIFVEKLAGGSELTIPVTIINGSKPGPCFWINGRKILTSFWFNKFTINKIIVSAFKWETNI